MNPLDNLNKYSIILGSASPRRRQLLADLGKMGAKKIVYISCNPETLARDAKFLLSDGWRMGTVYPFDLFCRTGHVECCTAFEKNI